MVFAQHEESQPLPAWRRQHLGDRDRGSMVQRLDQSVEQLHPVLVVGLTGEPRFQPCRSRGVTRCCAQHGDQPPTDEVNGSGVKLSSDDVQFAQDEIGVTR